MATYLDLPCIKTSDFLTTLDIDDGECNININHIPERFRNIRINTDFQIILTCIEDFINAMNCISYHMVKYLPDEIYDFVSKNRKMCKTLIENYELFYNELNLLIMTKPEHLIKRCAKHGMFNLLKYAIKHTPSGTIPKKLCNYAVGNTQEHFKCFTYLYETHHLTNPNIMNKFTISHKMARKDVPICYLEYLHKNCCYLKEPCGVPFCKHTPWYTDCAETIAKNGDLKKLQYMYDMNFKFDHYVAKIAIIECNVSILKFVIKNNLPFYEARNSVFDLIMGNNHSNFEIEDEDKVLNMIKYLIEIGYRLIDIYCSEIYKKFVEKNYVLCVKFLIENKANLYINDITCAVINGNINLVKIMLNGMMKQNGFNGLLEEDDEDEDDDDDEDDEEEEEEDDKDLLNVITKAIEYGHYDILVFLIKNHFPIDKKMALIYAKKFGHEKCYDLLIKKGCKLVSN
jgi:hypothetical protein